VVELGGRVAITMNKALAETITQLPEQLRRSPAWDRGKDRARTLHGRNRRPSVTDPHSPWQPVVPST
jgi:IS30 family transposase